MPYRFVSFLFLVLAVLGGFGWFYWEHLFFQSPRVPDDTHVVAMNNHGAIYYMTRFEAAIGPGSWLLSALSIIACLYFRNKAS